MDTRSLYQKAHDASPAFSALDDEVGLLERRHDFLLTEISETQQELVSLSDHLRAGQLSGMAPEEAESRVSALTERLAGLNSDSLRACAALSDATAKRDTLFAELRAKL